MSELHLGISPWFWVVIAGTLLLILAYLYQLTAPAAVLHAEHGHGEHEHAEHAAADGGHSAGKEDSLMMANMAAEAGPSALAAVPMDETSLPDDLAIIEGIGPKIKSLLAAEGIDSFAKLAATDIARLRDILDAASLRIADPATWPTQAGMAATGDWEGLKNYQEQLKGGRQTA